VIFVQFFQFLGDHVPALGAFLVCVLVVCVLCFLAYKMGEHRANKKWQRDVEMMPQIIAQDIRERMEKRIVALDVRVKYLQERNDRMAPAFSALTTIAEAMLKDRQARTGGNL